MSVYSASKAFVVSLSLSLREELANSNVSVTVLCPSGVITKEEVVKALAKQGFWGWATSRYPDQLARYAIPRVYQKRAIIVPGALNWLLRLAGKLAPSALVTRIAAGRFRGPALRPTPERRIRQRIPSSDLQPIPAGN